MPTLSRRDWLACCGALAGTLAVPRQATALARLAPGAPLTAALVEPATLRLCFNENPHGPPQAAIRAASAALARANRYADQEEFDALAALIAEREGVTPAHVLLGTGSSELLGLAAVAFLHEGGELVTAEPAFPHLVAVGADTRLVNVCNPNNPTGTIVAGDRLLAFCEQVSGRAPVLVDEAYHELVDAPAHATMVPLAREGAPVLVMRTFSKVYGMAGYRVGYAIAPPALIERLRVHQTTDLGPAALAAAIAAYQDRAFVERSRRLAREARELTARGLDALGIRHIPSHTSFVWFESGPDRRDLPVWLHARGVRISGDVKPLTGDWVRVSIGTAGEMRRFLRELRAVWG